MKRLGLLIVLACATPAPAPPPAPAPVVDWCSDGRHVDAVEDRQALCIFTVNRPPRDGGR